MLSVWFDSRRKITCYYLVIV